MVATTFKTTTEDTGTATNMHHAKKTENAATTTTTKTTTTTTNVHQHVRIPNLHKHKDQQ